jgi:GTP-binding protein Era
MNAYVGQKIAITSPKPQTTRQRTLGILTLPQAQVIFIDTPGIHRPRDGLGRFMVAAARSALVGADLALFMVDISRPPRDEDRQIARLLRRNPEMPTILAMNKVDLLASEKEAPNREAYVALGELLEAMPLSATRGDNRAALLELIIENLPEGPRLYSPEQITDQPERVMAAELVREQVLRYTHQEVPYAVAVVVEEYAEREADLIYIAANIYVERDSQKGIVIGARGAMLKRIGQAARKEIETLLGSRVYLDLWVKVMPHWRRDERSLRELGYSLR